MRDNLIVGVFLAEFPRKMRRRLYKSTSNIESRGERMIAWLIPLLAAARKRKEQMEDCDKKKRSDQQLANDRLSIKETGA